MKQTSLSSDACPATMVGLAARRVIVLALAWLLPLIGGLLLVRRMAGALDAQPHGALLLLAVTLASLAALAVRWSMTRPSPWPALGSWVEQMRSLASWLQAIIPSLSLVALMAGLQGARAPGAAVAIGWLIVLAEELGYWCWTYREELQRLFEPASVMQNPPASVSTASVATVSTDADEEEPDGETGEEEAEEEGQEADARVTQQIVRRIDAAGHESLAGLLRIHFVPGQRVAQAHLGFCPPLASTPTIEFEQVEGPSARVKLAQVFPYGARFEIKLESPGAEAELVGLDFVAVEAVETANRP